MYPTNYHRVPVRLLRPQPIRTNPRLQILDYRRTPSGKSEAARTHGHGAALLAGYVVQLCLVRDGGEWFLETEARCYDEDVARYDDPDWFTRLLADIWRALQQKQVADEGRGYGRGAGRN